MSYDGYISLQTATKPIPPDDLAKGEEWTWWDAQPAWEAGLADLGNYTSNVSRMWTRALTAVAVDLEGVVIPEDGLLSLGDTSGWTCAVAAPLYRAAASWMVDHAEELRELNPPSGWGDYEGALKYMENAAEQCERYAAVRSDHGQSYLYWSH